MTDDDIRTPISTRLHAFREKHGLSRAELAAKLGVASITLHRWETGSTRPSPLAATKLEALEFGSVSLDETNVGTVPRLRGRAAGTTRAAASALRVESETIIGEGAQSLCVIPAPFVRNGPPDQSHFHHTLLSMQVESMLPRSDLAARLSMVESVSRSGPTAQHLLEKPRATAVSWNSNYGSHGWHRYVGRFPPHLIRALLNHFGATRRSVVCDPFVGSGTTAVECRLLGIPFVGIEICPLSAMISRVKSTFPEDADQVSRIATAFQSFYSDQWERLLNGRSISDITYPEVLERQGNRVLAFTNIERWFTVEALLGVSIAVEFGMLLAGFERELVLTALSAKMRSIGNVDVDVVRAEYSKQPRQSVNVGALVTRQLRKMSADIAATVSTHSGLLAAAESLALLEGSVLDVEVADQSIDYIITSPPYGVEAISYLRTHLLSYRALTAHLGHDPYETRDKTIGSEYLDHKVQSGPGRSQRLSPTCDAFFSGPPLHSDPKYLQRRAAMLQFSDDMLSVGERMARWLKPGGRVAFIIGNKRLGDEVIAMDAIVSELFSNSGLRPTGQIRHKLKTNNSNSQVPWQERVIQEESILFFQRS